MATTTKRNENGQLVCYIEEWKVAYLPANRDTVVVSPPYFFRERAERFARAVVSEGAEAVVLRSEHYKILPAPETRDWEAIVTIPTVS